MLNNFFEELKKKITDKKEIVPCLFLGDNLELTNSQIKEKSLDLLKYFEIPNSYLFIKEDLGEKIKIKEIKEFIGISNSKPAYKFQIFFIENIQNFTLQSANSLLKFFEEPGVTNIIFLSSKGENGILETILSRVQTIKINSKKNLIEKDNFYYELIDSYIISKKNDIFSYFYKNKLEKKEYINFLENLILYYKINIKYLKKVELLNELNEDLNGIKQNNLNAKFIVDKWILLL